MASIYGWRRLELVLGVNDDLPFKRDDPIVGRRRLLSRRPTVRMVGVRLVFVWLHE